MRIGYSFWGFLGDGIVDTPDGGRSHRATLIEALVGRGHDLVFLQRDRDRFEAADPVTPSRCRWSSGLPEIDLLVLEWRWPIAGRNCDVDPTGSDYTPDLDRQQELVEHYIVASRVPTCIWDKDLMMAPSEGLRQRRNVLVFEAALYPREGAHQLLFPMAEHALDRLRANPAPGATRRYDLVYVGNQYGRDDEFDAYFARPAAQLRHAVFGKWSRRQRWPHVTFRGRVGFPEVHKVYRTSIATPLLLPARYSRAGQMTQRIFEAALGGCVPLAPAEIRGVERLVPDDLRVKNGQDVLDACRRLARVDLATDVLSALGDRLEIFRVSHQLERLGSALQPLGVLL